MTARPCAAAAAIALALALSGCAQPGPPHLPRPALDPTPLAAGPATGTATDWPDSRWWQRWDDPALSALIDRALAAQPTLQQAAARVALAGAQSDAVAAAAQPQLDASGDATLQRFSARGLVPPALAGATRWSANVQLRGSGSLDLFGRRRAELDAAIGRERAAEADAQAARVWLAAQVATHWFALAQLLELDRIADDAQARREAVLALQRERESAGLQGAAERLAAEGALAQARVERQRSAEAIARERHALAELAALPPADLAAASPQLPGPAQPVLPRVLGADLLGRRADLLALRWRVEAAQREQAAAAARFYPDVDLNLFAGLSSLGLDQLINAAARTWGVGPALRLPMFDGGRLRAQQSARDAEADAAIDAWNAALLRAVREAADALAARQVLQTARDAQRRATQAADDARALAAQRVDAGLAGRLALLEADAAVLAQRRASVELNGRQLENEIALIHALGGGATARNPTEPSR